MFITINYKEVTMIKYPVQKLLLMLICIGTATQISIGAASNTVPTRRTPQAPATGNRFLDQLELLSDSDDDDDSTFVKNHQQKMQNMDTDLQNVTEHATNVIAQAQRNEQRLIKTLENTQQELKEGMQVTQRQLANIQTKFYQFLNTMQERFDLLKNEGTAFKEKHKANKTLIKRFEDAETKYKLDLTRYKDVLENAQVEQADASFAELKQLEKQIQEESNKLYNLLAAQT